MIDPLEPDGTADQALVSALEKIEAAPNGQWVELTTAEYEAYRKYIEESVNEH